MALYSCRAAFLGIALASMASAPATAREFRSSDVQIVDAPTVQAVMRMSALLRQRTGGQHGISVDHGDRDSENFTIAQVRTGALDMARVNLGVFNSRVPSTIVPSLPYLFSSTEHMRRVLDGPIGEQILASLEPEGFIGLCFYDMGARSFYSRKGPIHSVADMKGLAVRVQQSSISAQMIEALGAKPVQIASDQVAAALKAGVVDASENSWPAYVAAGHDRVAKYFSPTEHSMMPGVLVFSKRVWGELSPDEQRALRAAAKDSVSFMRGRLDSYELSARLKAEKSGVEVTEDVDRKSFADVLLPLYPTLLPDPALQALIKRVQAEAEIARVP